MILEKYFQVGSIKTTKKTVDKFISKINEGDLLHFAWKVETPMVSYAPRIDVNNITQGVKNRLTPSDIQRIEHRFNLTEVKFLSEVSDKNG